MAKVIVDESHIVKTQKEVDDILKAFKDLCESLIQKGDLILDDEEIDE